VKGNREWWKEIGNGGRKKGIVGGNRESLEEIGNGERK
jgi:hypothetical protein